MGNFFLSACLLTMLLITNNILLSEDLRKDKWEATEYIWNFGVISSCDIGPGPSPVRYFEKDPVFDENTYRYIRSGDIVWLKCRFLPQFYSQVLFTIENPFVLVISDGDESFPTDSGLIDKYIEKLLSHKKVVHVFAQNCDYKGKSNKVSHLPIGMDFHTIAYKGPNGGWGEVGSPLEQEYQLKQVIQTLKPTSARKKRAFIDFQHSDSLRGGEFRRYLQMGEDRTMIFNRLLKTGLIDYAGWMKRSDLWKTKGQYAFSVSPHGNGLDCHRTWEDLILGCIVIVKTSTLDKMYDGLPVVIVKDWDEVTPQNLDLWLTQYHDASSNPLYRERLSINYWLQKIYDAAMPYKNM